MAHEPNSVSIVGLGNMGLPMAARWLDAGFSVHGFDLAEQARDRLEEMGGISHSTAAAASQSAQFCVLMLPNSDIVDRVIDELIAERTLEPSTIVLDMSSSIPSNTIRNATRFRDQGITFLDAPVSGGVRGVVAGNLAIMVGGQPDEVELVRPLLSILGSVLHVGPIGSGHAAKVLNNMVGATHLWATSEAVVMAEKFGINPETMIEVLNASTGRSVSSEVKWPRFILTETYDSGFFASLLAKDAGIASQISTGLGYNDALAHSIANLWRHAAETLPQGADHTEVARYIRALIAEQVMNS